MSPRRRQLTHLLVQGLSAHLDSLMRSHGFTRSPRSLNYARRTSDTIHALRLHFQTSPTYAPNAIAHLQPHLTLDYPAINARALAIAQEDRGYYSIRNVPTINLPLEWVVPQQEQLRLYVLRDNDPTPALHIMRHHLSAHGIPFLDRCLTIAGLLEEYDKHVALRIFGAPPDVVRLGAAYLIQHKVDRAVDIWTKRLNRPGLYSQYENTLSYLHSLQLEGPGPVTTIPPAP